MKAPSTTWPVYFLFVLGAALVSAFGQSAAGDSSETPLLRKGETVVVRTIMPDSYPGSFAVLFPNGPSLCFDPVRGGINYLWDGTSIELEPARTGKIGRPVEIGGSRFYQETVKRPMRRGDAEAIPQFKFKGYLIREGYPVFLYQLDDCSIREEMRPLPEDCGVVRFFETDAPDETFWLLTGAQEEAVCSTPDGEWKEGKLRVTTDARGRFSMTIQKEKDEK